MSHISGVSRREPGRPSIRSLNGWRRAQRGTIAPPTRRGGSDFAASQADTTSEVDLDQLFNTLDRPTVDSLKQVIQGFARAYDGVGPKANRGFHYLNPFLSTSRRVFAELNSDQANLESLVVDAAGLMGTLNAKSPEISELVANLNGMLGTIGAQQASLASAVSQLPDFMRQFNTTLRAYAPELTGWFDDFGHSGFPDTFGGIGRISTTLNTFSLGAPGVPCPNLLDVLGVCTLNPASDLADALSLKNLRRCPGANERGLSEEQLTQAGTVECDPDQTPVGP
jgi:hypothetical protein